MPVDREKALGADLGESTGCYGPDPSLDGG
jgi:hypothetical protein